MENIIFWLTLIFLIWFLYNPVRNLILERSRQALFEIRDGIFDLALDDEDFSFDSDEYRIIRDEINYLIRFLHRKAFAERLVLNWFFSKDMKSKKTKTSDFLQACQKVKSSNAREKLLAYNYRMVFLSISCMVLRSPFLFFSVLALSPFAAAFILFKGWFFADKDAISETFHLSIQKSA